LYCKITSFLFFCAPYGIRLSYLCAKLQKRRLSMAHGPVGRKISLGPRKQKIKIIYLFHSLSMDSILELKFDQGIDEFFKKINAECEILQNKISELKMDRDIVISELKISQDIDEFLKKINAEFDILKNRIPELKIDPDMEEFLKEIKSDFDILKYKYKLRKVEKTILLSL